MEMARANQIGIASLPFREGLGAVALGLAKEAGTSTEGTSQTADLASYRSFVANRVTSGYRSSYQCGMLLA